MPAPNFVFRVELVCSRTKPTLSVGGTAYRVYTITLADMLAVVQSLTDWPFYVNASPITFEHDVCVQALMKVPGGSPVTKFLPLPSRPMGSVWDPSADPYYHPTATPADLDEICVANDSGMWWQLRLWPESI